MLHRSLALSSSQRSRGAAINMNDPRRPEACPATITCGQSVREVYAMIGADGSSSSLKSQSFGDFMRGAALAGTRGTASADAE